MRPREPSLQLARLGHEVTGLDPSLSLLRVLLGKGVEVACGRAESIPLAAACVDIVTAGQAFHWFDRPRALAEMQRVLRPGGAVGLLWNFRDEEVEWVAALSSIIGSEDAMSATMGPAGGFEVEVDSTLEMIGAEELEERIFPFEQHLSPQGLQALVASRSYVKILPDQERADLLSEVGELCRKHPQLEGRPTFPLPYRTVVFRAAGVGSGANEQSHGESRQ